MSEVRYLVSGDCSVCVEFGNAISPEINTRIRAFKIAVEQSAIDGIVRRFPRTARCLCIISRKSSVLRRSRKNLKA